jgi:hypothetical protein
MKNFVGWCISLSFLDLRQKNISGEMVPKGPSGIVEKVDLRGVPAIERILHITDILLELEQGLMDHKIGAIGEHRLERLSIPNQLFSASEVSLLSLDLSNIKV